MDARENAPAAPAQPAELQLVTFLLAGDEYGLAVTRVKEIVRVPAITRVPRVPAFVLGVANLRGSILPILDLVQRLGLPGTARTDDARVIVVELDGKPAGLLVDRVAEVLRAAADEVGPAPAASLDAGTPVAGIVRLDGGRRLVVLLEIAALLDESQLRQSVAAARKVASAAKEAAPRAAEAPAQAQELLVTFLLDGAEYALAIAAVQEIVRPGAIAKVPRSPAFIEGVLALRGGLLPVVNLRQRLDMPRAAASDDSRLLVVALDGVATGVRVDSVCEVLGVAAEAIEPPPPLFEGAEAMPVRGVAKLDGGRRLLLVLDEARLLTPRERKQVKAAASGPGEPAAPAASEPSAAQDQYVAFRLGEEEYGIDIRHVQEIIRYTRVTHVPRAPAHVEGIVSLRGRVLPVIDMRRRLSLPQAERTEATSIVVVDLDGARTGVIVDAVSEVLRFSGDAIEPPPPALSGAEAGLVSGVGRLDAARRMLLMLDLRRVLAGQRPG